MNKEFTREDFNKLSELYFEFGRQVLLALKEYCSIIEGFEETEYNYNYCDGYCHYIDIDIDGTLDKEKICIVCKRYSDEKYKIYIPIQFILSKEYRKELKNKYDQKREEIKSAVDKKAKSLEKLEKEKRQQQYLELKKEFDNEEDNIS